MTRGRAFQLDRTAALHRMMAGMVACGHHPDTVAREFNVSPRTVEVAMRELRVSFVQVKRKNGILGKTAENLARLKSARQERSESLRAKRQDYADLYASGMTLEEIGSKYGLSRERIRQQIVKLNGNTWVKATKVKVVERRRAEAKARKPRKLTFNEKVLRILAQSVKHDGCWFYNGPVAEAGYGKIHSGSSHRTLHSAVYAVFYGDYDSWMHIDHTCHCRSCINPAHLQLLSPSENTAKKKRGAFAEECRTRVSLGLPIHPNNMRFLNEVAA